MLAYCIFLCTCFMPSTVRAQSGGDYVVTRHTIDGGGVMDATGGDYKTHGTVGQPDAADISGGQYLVHGGFWVPLDTIAVPDPLLPTGEVAKTNRYLRFTAPAPVVAGTTEEVIRVKVVSLDGYPAPTTDTLYLGPPFQAPEEDSTQPGLTFTAAPLQCESYAHLWSGEGVISAYGAELMPGSTYEVQRASADCPNLISDEGCWSAPLSITTAKYGDVWPVFDGPGNPPQPDFNDIAALVNKFLATGPATAPIKAVAQLQPNCVFPERAIDFRDIATDVQAFLGVSYASSNFGPCTCPSSVTCGVTACSNDLNCVGFGDGLCVDGFCTDPCGRCTP